MSKNPHLDEKTDPKIPRNPDLCALVPSLGSRGVSRSYFLYWAHWSSCFRVPLLAQPRTHNAMYFIAVDESGPIASLVTAELTALLAKLSYVPITPYVELQ